MPSSLTPRPSREVCMPICIVPLSSSARYKTYTLPSRTIAAGLKVCSASHATGVCRIGSSKVAALSGVITGFPLAGRTNGPNCQLCAPDRAADRIRNERGRN